MKQAVDKQGDDLARSNQFRTKQNFAGVGREGETQNVGRFVFLPIAAIDFKHLARRRPADAQIVVGAEEVADEFGFNGAEA